MLKANKLRHGAMIRALLLTAMLLMPTKAIAAKVAPELEDIVSMKGLVIDKYKGAVDKAQSAFLVQSGLNTKYNKLKNKIDMAATNIEKRTIASAIESIQPYMPINIEYVAALTGVAYTIGVKKSFAKNFRNPFNKDIMHYVLWTPEKSETGIVIRF